jgi:hypothetical protein
MALPDETKSKLMEAAIQRERSAFKARSRSPASAPVRGGIFDEAKRQTRDVVSGVKRVAQGGWPTVAVGIAVYAAHIRQMDRERNRQRGRLPQRSRKMKGIEREYA